MTAAGAGMVEAVGLFRPSATEPAPKPDPTCS